MPAPPQMAEVDGSSGAGALWVILAPLVLWALALLIVPPAGNFPLNDDWIYGDAVVQWLETGHYEGHPFATASFVAQAGWGTLFCWLFGFSFETLRWSTLVLWVLGAIGVGQMARAMGAHPWAAAMAGCLVIANPLALNLGYTFMTDVPFLALMAWAGYGYLRALEEPRLQRLLVASIFGALALLVRQLAPLLLLAYGLALLPRWRVWLSRENLLPSIALLVPWGLALALLQVLPNQAAALGHVWHPERLGETLAAQWAGGAKFYAASLVYLAVFTAPLINVAAGTWYRAGCWKRRLLWTVPFLTVLTIVTAAVPPRRLPYLRNILYDLGVGPLTLRDTMGENGPWTPVAVGDWWWIVTGLGLVGGGWICLAALLGLRDWVTSPGSASVRVRRRQQCFLGAWVILAVLALYHPWLPVRFDRYLLGAFLPMIVLVAAQCRSVSNSMRIISIVMLLFGFAFSVAAQHDYLAWNRVRWQAFDELTATGVAPNTIDGGYEFNGWYTSQPFIDALGAEAFLYAGAKGWWVLDDHYAVGWQTRPGYRILREMPYDAWLGADQVLLVLERD